MLKEISAGELLFKKFNKRSSLKNWITLQILFGQQSPSSTPGQVMCNVTHDVYHLFQRVVIPNLTWGLSVHSDVNAELTTVWCFLDQCHKQRYISKVINIYDVLEKQKFLTR